MPDDDAQTATRVTERPLESARTIPGLTALPPTPAAGTRVHVLERGGDVRAAAVLDLHGSPTEPDSPHLVMEACGDGDAAPSARRLDLAEELAPLVRAALAAAAADGHRRVTTGCDPMDLARLRTLEGLGFAATGRQPYFLLGGGHVEYVMGYADASGAIMDLAADPGADSGADAAG